jgi:hypothetical protein
MSDDQQGKAVVGELLRRYNGRGGTVCSTGDQIAQLYYTATTNGIFLQKKKLLTTNGTYY